MRMIYTGYRDVEEWCIRWPKEILHCSRSVIILERGVKVTSHYAMQEVSRAHSSDAVVSRRRNPRLRAPLTKEQIQAIPLHPQYVAGFIDGEGSFVVGFGRHKTLKRRIEIRLVFSSVLNFERGRCRNSPPYYENYRLRKNLRCILWPIRMVSACNI